MVGSLRSVDLVAVLRFDLVEVSRSRFDLAEV